MGYRSDVRIVVSKAGYKELEAYVKVEALKYATNFEKTDYDYNLLNHLDVFKALPDGSQYVIGWNYVKWYYGYEDVDIVMRGLQHLSDKGYNWVFDRIGEDYTDIEEQYNNDSFTDETLEWNYIIRQFDDEAAGFTVNNEVNLSE